MKPDITFDLEKIEYNVGFEMLGAIECNFIVKFYQYIQIW